MIRSSIKNTKTDEQLIADYRQSGDPVCVEILFNRYCQLVFAVALKYLHHHEESKDAVIEIFAKLPADLKKYDIKEFSHWIYIVTKNYCYHLLKKQKFNLPEDAIEKSDHRVWSGGSEDEVDFGKQLMDHLEESMTSLNEEQRLCINLFYLEEKSYEEVEQITGFNYNQVKSHIQNGKRNLKIYLTRFIKKDE